MLACNTYPEDHIQAARERITRQLTSYDLLARDADPEVLAVLAPDLFNGLVLQLELAFVHRTRGREGRDGNPMNEVRVLAASIVEHGGILTADKTIKLDPERSVLGLRPGDEIALDREDVGRLADAFLVAIEDRFGEG